MVPLRAVHSRSILPLHHFVSGMYMYNLNCNCKLINKNPNYDSNIIVLVSYMEYISIDSQRSDGGISILDRRNDHM